MKEEEENNNLIPDPAKEICEMEVGALGLKGRTKLSKSTKKWYVEIFFTSLGLSVMFGVISQLMLSHANLALALCLILLLVAVSVAFDLVGVAVAAINMRSLIDRRRRGERGAEEAIELIKNADRVACICTDVVGDICSILSGAGGVAISIIVISYFPGWNALFLSMVISSVIAAITVLGKAMGKSYALNCSTEVVMKVGKFLSVFHHNKEKKSKKEKKNKKS